MREDYCYYMREILIPMLQRARACAYSNFKAVTRNGDSPYQEHSSSELADMTGYKKSFFIEVGRSSIALALFDGWFDTDYSSNSLNELTTCLQIYTSISTCIIKAKFTRLS